MSASRAIVIGGGGFLGQSIVSRLRASGALVEVIGRKPYPFLEAQGVKCHQVDIEDKDALGRVLHGVDEVHHTAAKVGMWGRYADFYRANVLGTKNVVEACQTQGVKRLIFTSSPSVVFGGESHEGVDESVPYPASHLGYYSETKMQAEQLVLQANSEQGLRTCALRPHLIWGPGDPHLIPRILERGRSGRLAQVGDGSNRVDVVHIDNAALAHVLAAKELAGAGRCSGKAYFISQGESVLLWDFIAQVLSLAGIAPIKRKVSLETAYRIGALLESLYRMLRIKKEPPMTRFVALQLGCSHHFDISAAKRDFGYEPEISTEQGLRELFLSTRENERLGLETRQLG